MENVIYSPKPIPDLMVTGFQRKRRRAADGQRAPPPTPHPPRPPVKKLGSESRIFDRDPLSENEGPAPVYTNEAGLKSPFYSKQFPESFFDQTFENLQFLGEGSFAKVYKARSKDDGRVYAVKVFKQKFKGRADRDKHLKEVNRMKTLSESPHCVHLYRAWEEQGVLYMQMEYCSFGSLSQYCEGLTSAVPEDKLWEYLTDIALGIKHMHDHNMVHLDIKPANIFLSHDGTLKTGDFGQAGQAGSAGLEEGDPVYMSPELVSQEKFDKPTDIFSLGVTILDIGSDYILPSGGDPTWQWLREGKVPDCLFEHLSQELKTLIITMMSPNPSSRPTIEDVLCHPRIDAILQRRGRYEMLRSVPKTLIYIFDVIRGWFHALKNQVMIQVWNDEKLRREMNTPSLHIDSDEDDDHMNWVPDSPTLFPQMDDDEPRRITRSMKRQADSAAKHWGTIGKNLNKVFEQAQ